MIRERLRPDWAINNYSFRVYPAVERDETFWSLARSQKNCWNAMVAAWREYEKQIRPHKFRFDDASESDGAATMERPPKPSPDERKILLAAQTAAVKKALSEHGAELSYNERERLLLSFEAGAKLARKRDGLLNFKSGIKEVNFYHRWSGGGLKLADFFNKQKPVDAPPKDKAEAVDADSKKATKGRVTTIGWRVVGEQGEKKLVRGHLLLGAIRHKVDFILVMHRDFPPSAILKTATLSGKRSAARGWVWNLVFSLEKEPAELSEMFGFQPAAGLDVGWRKFDDYLRVGLIKDTAGHAYELRLPLNQGENRRLRQLRAKLEKRGAQLYETPLDFPGLWEQSEKAAERVEAMKLRLKTALDAKTFPPALDIYLKRALPKLRDTGLLKTRNMIRDVLFPAEGAELSEADAEPLTDVQKIELEKLLEELNAWDTEKREGERRTALFRERFMRRRSLKYREIAAWLKKNFAHLIWEGDLRLDQMAEETTKQRKKRDKERINEETGEAETPRRLTGDEQALKLSAKYRTIASLFQLRQFIKEKNGKVPADDAPWLIDGVTAYTTANCPLCGAEIVSDRLKVEIVCANEHRFDQDELAGDNLLNQLPDDLVYATHSAPVEIPKELKGYVVLLK
jgi:hypothetical protein